LFAALPSKHATFGVKKWLQNFTPDFWNKDLSYMTRTMEKIQQMMQDLLPRMDANQEKAKVSMAKLEARIDANRESDRSTFRPNT
jgi:uncharacterized protein YqiB (DUF1249 family)